MDYFYAYLSNILIFYVNIWCLNFAFSKYKSVYLYVALLLAEFGAYVVVHCITGEMDAHWKVPVSNFLTNMLMIQYIYRSVYFIGISVGYWFVILHFRSNNLINKMQSRHLMQQKRSAELERNLFKAKNAYLTSQINPHLLFNTLILFIAACTRYRKRPLKWWYYYQT